MKTREITKKEEFLSDFEYLSEDTSIIETTKINGTIGCIIKYRNASEMYDLTEVMNINNYTKEETLDYLTRTFKEIVDKKINNALLDFENSFETINLLELKEEEIKHIKYLISQSKFK